eukprot:scaffold25203_cov118-Isochrysis_galbana.AAC.4
MCLARKQPMIPAFWPGLWAFFPDQSSGKHLLNAHALHSNTPTSTHFGGPLHTATNDTEGDVVPSPSHYIPMECDRVERAPVPGISRLPVLATRPQIFTAQILSRL